MVHPSGLPTLSREQFSVTLSSGGLEVDQAGFVAGLILRSDASIISRCQSRTTRTIDVLRVYGRETDAWLEKMSTHPSGIALIFARTETATWQQWVWPYAHSIFFRDGRLFFHHPDGTRGKSNAGGPSALISYSHADTQAIRDSGLKGYLTAAKECLS